MPLPPRFVPLNPRASAGTGGEAWAGGDDLNTILGRLAPLGGLTKGIGKLADSPTLGNVGTGFSGLLGLTRGITGGNPGQAIGGAVNVGSSLAGALNYPGVSSALGAVGGPLTLATGLASGDPLSATLGGLQTGSLVSGALGGPTISSGLSSLAGMVPGLETAGLGTIGTLGAAAAPFLLAAFGAMGGFERDSAAHIKKQIEEYKDYAEDFPGLVQRRRAGANVFDTLGERDTPDEILQGLRTAASGRSANVEPAAWNVGHTPNTLTFKAPDLSAWNAASPALGGHNWASFLNLMDKGEQAGLDPGGKTGDWNLNPLGDSWAGEKQQDREGFHFQDDTNRTGEDYRTKLGFNNQAQFTLDQNNQPVWTGGARGQTQEAQDFGNAVGGIGQHLGVDFGRRGGDPGDWQNFDPEQLAGYGVTPGQYGPAALNYLRSFDPTVTERPEWASYAKALDPGNALADLDPLTLTPRKPITYASPFLATAPDSPGGGF